MNGLTADACNQTTIFAGDWWCSYLKAHSVYSPETLFRFTVLNACTGAPGGMAWAVSPTCDGKTWASDNLAVMTRLNGYLQPIRSSVCGVLPSYNWKVEKCTFSTSRGYGATRSLDGTKEYVHVFKAPKGKTLDLTPPYESFKSAHLLTTNRPLKMESNSQSLRLTLDDADAWNPLDTVILLDRDTTLTQRAIPSSDPAITTLATPLVTQLAGLHAAASPLHTFSAQLFRQKWQPMAASCWQCSWENLGGGSQAQVYGMFPGYFLSAYVGRCVTVSLGPGMHEGRLVLKPPAAALDVGLIPQRSRRPAMN